MKKLLPICFLFFVVHIASAQDDLLKVLKENQQQVTSEKVIATFKTLKLINSQTNETVHKRVLDFRIAHRFGNLSKKTGGGSHTFYGMDVASDIRVDFEYGITEKLEVGISRCKFNEDFEGLVKYRLLQQTTDNKIPLAITLFGNTSFTGKKDVAGDFEKLESDGSVSEAPARRLRYCAEAIIARKFSSGVSVLIVPAYVHRNFISDPLDKNDLIALGMGARVKITRSTCIIADYFYTFSDYRHNTAIPKFYDPLGIGIEIETGGHVFSLMFTNSPAIIETEFLDTHDSWADGGIKFTFNISRNFRL